MEQIYLNHPVYNSLQERKRERRLESSVKGWEKLSAKESLVIIIRMLEASRRFEYFVN